MKKIATLLLAICLVVPCFSFLSQAAKAIQFVDPDTAVGETLELMGVVKDTSGSNLGTLDISITMSYDTEMLKFKSGDGITESEKGTLVYEGETTSADRERKEFVMKFDVLKEGTTTVKVVESTIKNSSGVAQDFSEGKSIITIAEGTGTGTGTDEPDEPSEDDEPDTVAIDGVTYTIADKIPDSAIPEGYEKTTLEYGIDNEICALFNDSTQVYLAYLVDEEFEGTLFRYVEEDATFAPYEEISISDNVSIVLLSDVSDVELPKEYVETELVINVDGPSFPAWQKKGEQDFCIVYAMNSSGEKSLYQLDTIEGTYQRFTAPEIEEKDTSFIGRLSETLQNHMDYVILVTGLGFLLFVLIIIILSVKLYNRNAELDEIYEEYGIDDEEETKDDVIISLGEDDEDDVITSFDDEDDHDSYNEEYMVEYEEESEEEPDEIFVQNDMREVFSEDEEIDSVVNEVVQDDIQFVVEDVIRENEEEETLGAVLKKQVTLNDSSEETYFDDDEDVFENISLDFIDLDD